MAEINITDVTNEDNTGILDIILRKYESIIQGEFNKGNIAQSDYSSAFIMAIKLHYSKHFNSY